MPPKTKLIPPGQAITDSPSPPPSRKQVPSPTTFVLGLTGGIGSGKSTVARKFASLGNALLISADVLGHEVLNTRSVKTAARKRWGDSILNSEGSINRSELARIVFGSRPECLEERRYLESITHPLILKRLKTEIDNGIKNHYSIIVLDAPLLFEAGLESLCDGVVFVEATEKVRRERVQNRHWAAGELERREKCQFSLKEKAKKSQYVIDNNGSYEKMEEQVLLLFTKLVNSNKN